MSRVDKNEYKDWIGFGARVRKHRESIGLTREKFADMIDRTENYVLSLEKGDKSCSVHTLYQISKSLKVPTDTLLYGDVDMKEDYTNKEILQNIIERCNEVEAAVLKDIAVATFPHLNQIKEVRKNHKEKND